MMRRLPKIIYNPVSIIGLVIVTFNTGFIIFLSVVDALSKRVHPYADLVIWFILPVLVLMGIALIIIGIRRERQKEREGTQVEHRFLVVDFNNPKHRKVVLGLLTIFLLLSLLYAFAGYKAYEYTESESFCGMTCHRVMGPEFRSHAYSVHAEIACVDCHVGPGAKYYLLYKLKGTRQLFDVMFDRYPRPIPTPVVDLRPSQDVCENCHGPKYQINQRLESRSYFLADKKNTRKTINLLLRMGKAEVTTEHPPKMHWHSSTTEEIVYAATDTKRTVIPWIRVKRLDGKERVYRSSEVQMSDAEVVKAQKRRMDCVDCHNRLGHPYNPPSLILNALLTVQLVDPELPEIKRVAVEALDAEYASQGDAQKRIETSIKDFYKTTYPALYSNKESAIVAAIGAIQRAYARNYDPSMKVSWKNFPNNQGHRFSAGCFRCHDGKHRSDDGVVLSRDCSLCHLLIERAGEAAGSPDRAVFQVMKYPHPVDIGNAWKEMLCHECHGAGK
jgi:nitrate/TMAO reductase-like tetraheme cytochrome c subunit